MFFKWLRKKKREWRKLVPDMPNIPEPPPEKPRSEFQVTFQGKTVSVWLRSDATKEDVWKAAMHNFELIAQIHIARIDRIEAGDGVGDN